jgi:hypothetical protein
MKNCPGHKICLEGTICLRFYYILESNQNKFRFTEEHMCFQKIVERMKWMLYLTRRAQRLNLTAAFALTSLLINVIF